MRKHGVTRRQLAALYLAVVSIVLPIGLGGCTAKRVITTTEHTPVEQLLLTEAIDRTIDKLSWPDLRGKVVFIDVGTSEAPLAEPQEKTVYVRQALAAQLAQRGAILVPQVGEADYVALALLGALGTEQQDQFLGLPPIQSVLIPFSLPELALYKATRLTGFAKLELVITDRRRGGVEHRSGPARAETYWRIRQIPFSTSITTDTSRLPSPATEK